MSVFWLVRTHRLLGVLMILPLCAWAATGLVFFIKPGYGEAYAMLTVKRYPLVRGEENASQERLAVAPAVDWLSYRVVRTVLGYHLLVDTGAGPRHLNASTGEPWPEPASTELRRLVTDAISANHQRYGVLAAEQTAPDRLQTTTGVTIQWDWSRLQLRQRGADTDRIDWLYRVHYLQWTGHKSMDRLLGMVGLVLLVGLAVSGGWLFWRGGRLLPKDRSTSAGESA